MSAPGYKTIKSEPGQDGKEEPPLPPPPQQQQPVPTDEPPEKKIKVSWNDISRCLGITVEPHLIDHPD